MTTMRNTLRAVFGAPVMVVQHVWRLRYVDRSTRNVERLSAEPPRLIDSDGDPIQNRLDGVGPLVMRSYSVEIDGGAMSASETLAAFGHRPNSFSPQHVAGFRTLEGDEAAGLTVGDVVVVELPGPWNGPVRVDELEDRSLTLSTLDGHMEAGQIRFAAEDLKNGGVRFEVRSWARAGDEAFRWLHLAVGVGKEAQTAMWVHTCARSVTVAGGVRVGPIVVVTEILDGSS